MQEFEVKKKDSDQTLIKYLGRLLPAAPVGLLHKQLRNKNIVLNGARSDGRDILKEGDRVRIYMSDETIGKFSGKSTENDVSAYMAAFERFGAPDILYEDEDVLVFNKPAGILSQKADASDLSANEWIIGYLLKEGKLDPASLVSFTPSVCNRLDRNTVGLMLFGKTVYGTNLLNAMVRDHSLKKYYKTIVHGHFDKEGRISSYIVKDEVSNKVKVFSEERPGSSLISAEFKLLNYNRASDLSEVEVLLYTGKSHQIRAQLSHLGFPVYGDRKYGSEGDIKSKHHVLIAYRLLFPELLNHAALSGKEIVLDTRQFFKDFY